LDLSSVDLAMLFQPGFENHRQWFSRPDLEVLASSGIAVGVTSYGRDEYFIDREVLAAHGYSTQGEAEENPFFVEMGHENVRWGHTLWRLGSASPGEGFQPDGERLEAIGRLSRALAWWHRIGFVSEALNFGSERDLALPGVGRSRLIYLMGDLYVQPDTGELLRDRAGALQPVNMCVPPDLMSRRPLPGPESLDGALWAAEVFERLG
jgi:hypothetical protein